MRAPAHGPATIWCMGRGSRTSANSVGAPTARGRASAPQLVVRRIFDAGSRFPELRAWLADEFRKPIEQRDPVAADVFAELELDAAAGRRHLLESERFRALLAESALARAA